MGGKTKLTKADENNVHSQCGEDGILESIFKALGIDSGIAVEFGAWDGLHLSNTALLRTRGWRTVLIEANLDRVAHLRRLEDEKTTVVHALVEPYGAQSLDSILDRLDVADVDFVSIDIDGDDVGVFRHLSRRPIVLCIEFNPGIPPPHVFFNPERAHKGSSLAAIQEIATEKGYELVYATYCNALLVRQPEAQLIERYDMYQAFYLSHRPALLCMYDGEFRVETAHGGATLRHPFSTVPVYVPRLPAALLGWPPTLPKVMMMYLYCCVAAPWFYARALLRESAIQLKRRLHPEP